MTTLDFSRINAEIAAQEERLAQMRKFLQVRTLSFAQALPGIVKFLADQYIYDCRFGNVYSSGMATLGTEYADAAGLIVHCTASVSINFKNKEMHAEKLEKLWYEQINQRYNIGISQTRITETTVKFQLYVK